MGKKMASAQAHEPKSGGGKPAGKVSGSPVGASGLSGAVSHLGEIARRHGMGKK